jgi:hypothetical protein
MRKAWQFIRTPIQFEDQAFKLFFKSLFSTTLLAYSRSILPILPENVLGFNWSGISWIVMLTVTIIMLPKRKGFSFPVGMWFPWVLYLIITLIINFSFIGLQLTLQYLLPILVGLAASSFSYSWIKLRWLFQSLLRTVIVVYLLFVFYTTLYGYTPHMAATPMFLSVTAIIALGLYFFTRRKIFLALYLLLFLMPFISVTRMGLMVFGLIFAFHFANKGLGSKIVAGVFGAVLMLLVVSSEGFQQKTFYDEEGNLSDISFNYYENKSLNSSGRLSWKLALAAGLEKEPIWGNGPRADASVLGEVIGKETGEAHNDYMSVRYNYGYVGLILLLIGFSGSFFQFFRMSKKNKDLLFQLLVLSSMTLFIPFLLFMYSDNILKYTIWFPNYFFAVIGIVFSTFYRGFQNV